MADPEVVDKRERAAKLLCAGNLTDEQIADDLGICRKTLWNWRQAPEFQSRVEAILEEYRAETRRLGLSNRDRRIRALNDRWNRLQRVLEARADDKTMANVPGGTTGFLVRDVKTVGQGEDAEIVNLYKVDTATLKELREIEKQAAQELGQWVEKKDVTSGGVPLITVIEVIKPDGVDETQSD